MAKNKMIICDHCGEEIAASAKACPKCGAKIKKPFYKKVWFWILIAVLVIGIGGAAGGSGGSGDSSAPAASEDAPAAEEEKIEYTDVTTDELSDALDNNPAAASDTYKGKYWSVTGKLSNIDSDGNYISMTDINDEFDFINIQCYIKSDEQLAAVKKLSKGQTVTVKGKIKDVGEVLGYQMDVDEIAAD